MQYLTILAAMVMAASVEYELIETDELGRPLPTPTIGIYTLPSADPWRPQDDEAQDTGSRMPA